MRTLSTAVDCTRPLQQRRGRPGHRWCCALTVEYAMATLAQNAADLRELMTANVTAALQSSWKTISFTLKFVDADDDDEQSI